MTTEPIFYQSMFSIVSDLLANEDIPDHKSLAKRLVIAFCLKHQGEIHRVPALKQIEKRKRDQAIIADSAMFSAQELSVRYDLTPPTIYKIIGGKNVRN